MFLLLVFSSVRSIVITSTESSGVPALFRDFQALNPSSPLLKGETPEACTGWGTWLLAPAKKGQSRGVGGAGALGGARSQGHFPPTIRSCPQKAVLLLKSLGLRQDCAVEGISLSGLSWAWLREAARGGEGGAER